jgi:hypothetical protein
VQIFLKVVLDDFLQQTLQGGTAAQEGFVLWTMQRLG